MLKHLPVNHLDDFDDLYGDMTSYDFDATLNIRGHRYLYQFSIV